LSQITTICCYNSNTNTLNISHPEKNCVTSQKNAHFELCPQEVCLRPYLPSGIASHVYFLKWPREGRSVVVRLLRLHRPGPWFFLSPEKLYFSSCDSVLLGMGHVGYFPYVINLINVLYTNISFSHACYGCDT
jgi:hypothetical protein